MISIDLVIVMIQINPDLKGQMIFENSLNSVKHGVIPHHNIQPFNFVIINILNMMILVDANF